MKNASVWSSLTARCVSKARSDRRSTFSLNNGTHRGARITRREALAGGAAAILASGALVSPRAALAATETRVFDIYRGSSLVGRQSLAPSLSGDAVGMRIDIEIAVKVLGFTAYRYEHTNNERWRGGRLVALDSRTNDDGVDDFCTARAEAGGLALNGSRGATVVDANARPTSYWNYDNFTAPVWFSSQSGDALDLTFTRTALSNGGDRWAVRGDFATDLEYDAAGEWRGCAFDGQGAQIVYRQTAPGGAFRSIV